MIILAIDTSCDETAVAVTKGRKILANEIYSQILIHKKWGGVVPNLARRAHEERFDTVLETALKKAKISLSEVNYIAVTQGPGLAPALEVGINKACRLAKKYKKKIVSVNHMEGHIYSCFAQNRQGNPKRNFVFPYLSILISGGHTELVLFKNHCQYEVIGETIDDAAGEALDKAAKLLGLGYPGGPVIERLARRGSAKYHHFPRPMTASKNLDFSFSGLKTSFYYFVRNLSEKEKIDHLEDLAASFQQAVFDSIVKKAEMALKTTKVSRFITAGGVVANQKLRKMTRELAVSNNGSVIFPTFKSLYGDNAAMIGVAAYFKAKKGLFVINSDSLDRIPRMHL